MVTVTRTSTNRLMELKFIIAAGNTALDSYFDEMQFAASRLVYFCHGE